MADQDGRHSDMITQSLRYVTSSFHDVDVKGDFFRRTIYPQVSLSHLSYSWSYGGSGDSQNRVNISVRLIMVPITAIMRIRLWNFDYCLLNAGLTVFL